MMKEDIKMKNTENFLENNKGSFPLNIRKWVPKLNVDMNSNKHFRLMSYNILCDSLLSISTNIKESELNKMSYLKWQERRKKIIEEITALKPDIICLQELEKDDLLISELGKMKFDSCYKPRTGDHSEGCGIFWNFDKFTLENLYSLEFNMMNNPENFGKYDEKFIYSRDNIAVFSVLRLNSNPNKGLIVCSTHIIFNQNRGDIKLGQITQVLNTIKLLIGKYSNSFPDGLSEILCGDFNSVPNSACYKYITGNSIDCNELDRRRISNQSQGNIKSLEPARLNQLLLKYVTSKFDEKKHRTEDFFSNVNWFNELLSVEPVFDENNQEFKLKFKDNFKTNTQNLILMPPFPMQSAYSSVMRNILDYINFHKNLQFNLASEEQHKKLLESNLILKSLSEHVDDINVLDNINVYGIKIGINEIEKTNNFVKHFTLEPPMTYYGHNCFSTLDYIFYNGKINPIRSLNIPDVRKVAMDWGEMPNEIFPSDHISLCVDFHILN